MTVGLRQPTPEEQAVIASAWSARQTVRKAMNARTGDPAIERFVVSTDCWGNERDHIESLYGVPVLHDPTLPPGTLLYSIGTLKA